MTLNVLLERMAGRFVIAFNNSVSNNLKKKEKKLKWRITV